MQPVETVYVDSTTVACEGGPNPALGHPRIYLNMKNHGSVECPYCGRHYILKEGAPAEGGH